MDISPGKLSWVYYGTSRDHNHHKPFIPQGVVKIAVQIPRETSNKFFISRLTHGFRVGLKNLFLSSILLIRTWQRPSNTPRWWMSIYKQRLLNIILLVSSAKQTSWMPTLYGRFRIIPKHHRPNKWRLIMDIFHPADLSVNDGIQKELCSLSYITATHHTMDLDRGALLAIMDIESAPHLLSMHPADCYLLAMVWNKGIYVDTVLLFALRSAPKLFNILIGLLLWILNHKGTSQTIHFLDDFLTMGPAMFSMYHDNLNSMMNVFEQLADFGKIGRTVSLSHILGHYS